MVILSQHSTEQCSTLFQNHVGYVLFVDYKLTGLHSLLQLGYTKSKTWDCIILLSCPVQSLTARALTPSMVRKYSCSKGIPEVETKNHNSHHAPHFCNSGRGKGSRDWRETN